MDELTIVVIAISICVCISILFVGGFGVYFINLKKTQANDTTTSTTSTKSTSASNTSSLRANDSQSTSKSDIILKTVVPKGKGTELDCTVNLNKYTCTSPVDNKVIMLIEGPIFKISSSTEQDSFKNETINYYIIAPYVFLVDAILSIASGEKVINSLQDLLDFFNDMDKKYILENTIPDKCIQVPIKTREEAKAPYNTTCIFFPGLNKIDAIAKIFEKTFLIYLSNQVLTDYFSMVNDKINQVSPSLTILEYIMYLSLLNKIKNSNYNYYTLCTSDNSNVNC